MFIQAAKLFIDPLQIVETPVLLLAVWAEKKYKKSKFGVKGLSNFSKQIIQNVLEGSRSAQNFPLLRELLLLEFGTTD